MALAFDPGREFFLSHFWRVGLLCGACLLANDGAGPHPVGAVEATATAVTIVDTLIVTAGEVAGPVAPTTTSLVTRLELDSAGGFGDLSELLSRVAGLQIARLGGWGATAVPSLRGSAAAQIRFFIDGMPLSEAQTGLADFSRIPVERLQAVEVHRGVVPVGLAGVGGAGAINFVTRQRSDGVDLALQLGSFGRRGGRITIGATTPDRSRSGLLVVHGQRAENDYEYRDHNQTFHRTDDDTVRVRQNAWVKEWGVWGQGRWDLGPVSARGSLGHTRRDGGRPGPLGFASPHAGVRYDRLDGQLHLAWADRHLLAEVAAGRGDEFLYDPQAEVGFRPGTTQATSEDLATRLVWSPTILPGRLGAETGLAWRSQWQIEIRAEAAEPERRRRTTAAFAGLSLELASSRLRISPAWRWQHTHDNFAAIPLFPWLLPGPHNRRDDVSPSLGAVWTVVPGQVWCEAHGSRTVRTPTWIELFGLSGGVDGNPELEPEQITAADLAVSLRRGRGLAGRLAVFFAETEDKIIFVQNSQRTSKALNFGRTVARGAELELALGLPWRLDFRGNVTAQRVEDRGAEPFYYGNRLPFLPDLEIHARLSGQRGEWRYWCEAGHQSSNHLDRANTELNRAPARTRWNVGVEREWYPTWLGDAGAFSLRGEVINLTDTTVYDVEGFPLPGQSWHLMARVRR